jgi:hypothetical protein
MKRRVQSTLRCCSSHVSQTHPTRLELKAEPVGAEIPAIASTRS